MSDIELDKNVKRKFSKKISSCLSTEKSSSGLDLINILIDRMLGWCKVPDCNVSIIENLVFNLVIASAILWYDLMNVT